MRGRVVDGATGAPIEGVVVTLMKGIASQQAAGRQATDRAGRFVFASVPAAMPYQLHAAKPGYFDGSGRRVTPAAGEWLRDAEIRIWGPATISGTVRDERGAGVLAIDYVVIVFSADRAHWFPGAQRTRAVRPAADGVFSVSELPAGAYLVAAETDAYPDEWQRAEFLNQLASFAVPVTVRSGETARQDLQIAER